MKSILIILSVLLASSLQATIVTYDYYGTVTSIQGQPEPKFGGLVAGDAIKGSFTYDTAAINQGDSVSGKYAMIGQSLQLGAFSYSPSTSSIQIDTSNGYYWAVTGGDSEYSMSLVLYDFTAPYLQVDTLLRPPPDNSSVDGHFGSIHFFNGNEGERTHLNFDLDSVVLHSSTVPEAGSTWTLLALSFAALLFRGRVICA